MQRGLRNPTMQQGIYRTRRYTIKAVRCIIDQYEMLQYLFYATRAGPRNNNAAMSRRRTQRKSRGSMQHRRKDATQRDTCDIHKTFSCNIEKQCDATTMGNAAE